MKCEYCGEMEVSSGSTICDYCEDAIQRDIAESYQREESQNRWKEHFEQEQRDWDEYVERWRKWRDSQDE